MLFVGAPTKTKAPKYVGAGNSSCLERSAKSQFNICAICAPESAYSAPQHPLNQQLQSAESAAAAFPPACLGGHGVSAYEQNTQQSPGLGRRRVPHDTQSWMYTQALTGMTSSVSARHTGQRSRALCFIRALSVLQEIQGALPPRHAPPLRGLPGSGDGRARVQAAGDTAASIRRSRRSARMTWSHTSATERAK